MVDETLLFQNIQIGHMPLILQWVWSAHAG